MRGSDYAELRAFAAVVRHGSFSRAAVHLGLSPSALSQTIRALEDRLGQRLLNRTTRSVAPSVRWSWVTSSEKAAKDEPIMPLRAAKRDRASA